jgi:hypothetical protein
MIAMFEVARETFMCSHQCSVIAEQDAANDGCQHCC